MNRVIPLGSDGSTNTDALAPSNAGAIPENFRSSNLYIYNLPDSYMQENLMTDFSRFGSVTEARILPQVLYAGIPVRNRLGLVAFRDQSSALAAKLFTDENPFQGVLLKTSLGDSSCSVIQVRIPENVDLIDAVADHMVELGDKGAIEFEDKLRSHAKFSFLNNRQSIEYTYLKWRIVASLCPDFTTGAFRFLPSSPFWIPPVLSPVKQARFGSGEHPLTPQDVSTLTGIIKTINSTRNSVKSAMVFCIDRSHASHAIVDLILSTNPLISDGHIGRLYLISDLLFNAACNKKSAWSFRTAIEKALPSYFACMRCLAIDSERIRERVARVLSVWEKWSMFSPEFLNGIKLFWGDLRNKYPESLDSIVVVENEDAVYIEMKYHGLMVVYDGHDIGRFHAYLRDIYCIDADVDGESLSASDMEDVDGAPLDSVDRRGWTSAVSSNSTPFFGLKFHSKSTPAPQSKDTQPEHKVEKIDIQDLFIQSTASPKIKRRRDEDQVVPRKYRNLSYR